MPRTILFVFIHGFKGNEDTFGKFPESLKGRISRALPAVRVCTAVYPKYETKGELQECVSRLRDWLQNTVIDLEVENKTASPMVDPSVHVYLVGHSMGGIIAAELALLLAAEQPLHHKLNEEDDDQEPAMEPIMFPHIQGVLAFDTPFLGIAPGVFSYGAEGHYQNASTAYNTATQVAGMFGLGGKKDTPGAANNAQPANVDVAAPPPWQTWGRYAMYVGAAGAMVGAGGAALWSQRQNISAGVDWVSSHLVFVGCLARGAELKRRLAGMASVQRDRGIHFANFYTCLGSGASPLMAKSGDSRLSWSEMIIRSSNRTFCVLPDDVENAKGNEPKPEQPGVRWIKAINHRASDEVKAHTSMFQLKENPHFYDMVEDVRKAVVGSIDKGWYETRDANDDFMDADDVVMVNKSP
ncbi:hypothetical protein N7492_006885 [Penicillium capsulatum]|uniref:DUF676 domain-containing protein n=1 Tax=Penicillium capsulatum TaxID=69766 RepID=A0A9W9LLB0_9EURO|nr:hypothetical protein N7492_006885 [Penicillium capsulatum]KAJ6116719.1 hypothetical protein N7512_006444 [Penicillium capsulatum]